MATPAEQQHFYDESSIERDQISPSITIARTRFIQNAVPADFDLVYTENLWAASNNTLAGCAHFKDWQTADDWVIVADASQRGDAASLLATCETLAVGANSMRMVEPQDLLRALAEPTESANSCQRSKVIVLAVSSADLSHCAEILKRRFESEATNEHDKVLTQLLWLPSDRASQTLPVHSELLSLPCASVTIVCDLCKLSNERGAMKASLTIMLRAALYIDPQLAHWIEGNLSALAEGDEALHRKAIMRTANSLFNVKRRRSEEPDLPPAFTDTLAIQLSSQECTAALPWRTLSRQLIIDIQYAVQASHLEDGAEQRIAHMLRKLNLSDPNMITDSMAEDETDAMKNQTLNNRSHLVLQGLGESMITRKFVATAWSTAVTTPTMR